MKILFAINSLVIGGAERVFVNQVNELNKDPNFDVWVLTTVTEKGKKTFRDQLQISADKTIQFSYKNVLDLAAMPKVKKFLDKEKFDAVISYLFLTNFSLRILAKLSHVPVICSYEQNVYINKSKVQILADKILSYFTDAIIPVSKEVLEFTSKQENIPKSKFKLIYNAVPLDFKELSTQEKSVFKKDLGIPEAAMVVSNAGSLVEQKGQTYFIEAAKKIIDKNSDKEIYFLIGGEGKLRSELEQLAADLNIADKIKMLGILPINKLFSVTDIFVMPSLWEGLSLVMLEAMAAGKPMVISDVSGAKEVLNDGTDGLIVPVKDPVAIAEKVNLLINDSNLRSKISKGALARVKDFSIQKNVKILKETILNIYQKKRG